MSAEEIKAAVEEANKPLLDRLNHLEGIAQQRTLAFIAVVLALVVAVVSVLYGINREHALKDQIGVNRVVVCAAAKTAALAPRKTPLAGESRAHYLDRLEAQREQLIATGSLDCTSLGGFATFSYLRGKAIAEIEEILRRLAPGKLHRALEQEHSTMGCCKGNSSEVVTPSSPSASAGGGSGAASPVHGEPSGSAPSNPHHHESSGAGGSPNPGGGGGGSGGGGSTQPVPEANPPASTAPSGEENKTTTPEESSGLPTIIHGVCTATGLHVELVGGIAVCPH